MGGRKGWCSLRSQWCRKRPGLDKTLPPSCLDREPSPSWLPSSLSGASTLPARPHGASSCSCTSAGVHSLDLSHLRSEGCLRSDQSF